MTDLLFYLTHTPTLAQLVASQTLSLCSPYVSRQHHDGFLHDGLDGGFNRGVCGVQLHCSGTWSAAPHPRHAHACQRYRIVTTWWKEHTPTCTTRMRSRAERCSRWIQVQFQRPRSFAQRIKKREQKQHFHHLIINKKEELCCESIHHLIIHNSSQSEQRCCWWCPHGNRSIVYKFALI